MTTTMTGAFRTLLVLALVLLFAGPALAQQPERIGGNLVKAGTYKGRQIEYVAR